MPAVVTECISEIEARGLMSEGIYRVPGSQDQVEALKLAFERGKVDVCISLGRVCIWGSCMYTFFFNTLKDSQPFLSLFMYLIDYYIHESGPRTAE